MMQICRILESSPGPESIEVSGWVRTRRDGKDLSFIEINDGSCLKNLQVIATTAMADYDSIVQRLTTGCSVRFKGLLKESPAKGQRVELEAEEVEVYGWSAADILSFTEKKTFL